MESWIKEIKDYIPFNQQEASDKELILEATNNYNNLLTRENKFMHMTSSGYIVNKERTKVLMIYHKIYNSWAWTGGHTDGDNNMLHVALKEATEETGVTVFKPVSNNIFSLDVLPVNGHVKKGNFVSPHLHLSIAYLLEANESDELITNTEETNGVKWLPINELHIHCSEPEMIKLYNKFNEKILKFKF